MKISSLNSQLRQYYNINANLNEQISDFKIEKLTFTKATKKTKEEVDNLKTVICQKNEMIAELNRNINDLNEKLKKDEKFIDVIYHKLNNKLPNDMKKWIFSFFEKFSDIYGEAGRAQEVKGILKNSNINFSII